MTRGSRDELVSAARAEATADALRQAGVLQRLELSLAPCSMTSSDQDDLTSCNLQFIMGGYQDALCQPPIPFVVLHEISISCTVRMQVSR